MRRSMSARLVIAGFTVAGLAFAACGSGEPHKFSKSGYCRAAKSIGRKYPVLDGSPSQAREAVSDFKRLRDTAPDNLVDDVDLWVRFLDANGRSDSTALEKLRDKVAPAVEKVKASLLKDCGVGPTTSSSAPASPPSS